VKPESKAEVAEVEAPPFPNSICHRCANCRIVATKTSKFLMCTALAVKYPRQPVSDCRAFESADRADRR
jgi:hypothetical protein